MTQPTSSAIDSPCTNHHTKAVQSLSGILILSLILNGCASTPEYLPPPSRNQSSHDAQREQLNYATGQELGGAAVSGAIGGILGPIGIIVTAIGTASTRRHAQNLYWQSVDNTELVGIVIEDATKKRNQEYLDHPRWFSNLPAKQSLPQELNVDVGSGNSFVLPVKTTIHPQVGDIVTILAPATTHKLMSPHADFYQDMPQIVEIRCQKQDMACMKAADNALGVAKRFSTTSTEKGAKQQE